MMTMLKLLKLLEAEHVGPLRHVIVRDLPYLCMFFFETLGACLCVCDSQWISL